MTIWFATGNAHKKTELSAILLAHGVNCKLLIPKDAGLDFDPEETGTSFHENALLKARELRALLDNARPALFNPGDPVIADDSGICVDALGGRPGIYSARYAGREQRDCRKSILKKIPHSGTEARRMQRRHGGLSLHFQDSSCSTRINRTTTPSPIPSSAVPLCRRVGFSHRHQGTQREESAKKLEAGERNALLLEELGDAEDRRARFVCAMVLMYGPSRFFIAQETLEGEIVKSLEHAKGARGFGYDPILFIPELGRTVAELSEEEKNTISHRGKAGKIIAGIITRE